MYGLVHGFGPRQHATERRLTKQRRCAHGDDLGGGAEGGQRWLVVAMATMHRETQRGKKQENERPTRGCGEVTFGCLSFHKAFAVASSSQLRLDIPAKVVCQRHFRHSDPQHSLTEPTGCFCNRSPRRDELYRALGFGHAGLGSVKRMFCPPATLYAGGRTFSQARRAGY